MNLAERFKQFSATITEDVKPIGTGKVLLIDGLNTYLRAFAATPTMNDDGAHVGGISGFLLSVGATIRAFKPSRVVLVFDGAGGSKRRRAEFADYKSGRRNMTKLNRTYDFNTLEEEKEAQKWQLLVLMEMLRCLPLIIIHQDLVEADDVLAYLAQVAEMRGQEAIIVSTDKDFLQCVNEKITVWNPVKKKMYRPDSIVEDYGFHPNNFVLYRAVTGDKSDSIPGVEGIKEKTLIKYFPELAEAEQKDVEFLFESAARQIAAIKKPPVALTTLMASREVITRNVKLMRLDEVSMSGNTQMTVLDIFEKPIPKLNKAELTKLVRCHKLYGAFGMFDRWVFETFHSLQRLSNGKD